MDRNCSEVRVRVPATSANLGPNLIAWCWRWSCTWISRRVSKMDWAWKSWRLGKGRGKCSWTSATQFIGEWLEHLPSLVGHGRGCLLKSIVRYRWPVAWAAEGVVARVMVLLLLKVSLSLEGGYDGAS